MMRKLSLLFIFLVLFSLLPATFAEAESIEIKFYYSPSCGHCVKLAEHLDELEEKYGERIFVNRMNTRENMQEFVEIQQQHGITTGEMGTVPKVFIEDFYCIGDTPCIREIEPKLIELGVEKSNDDANSTNGDQNVSNGDGDGDQNFSYASGNVIVNGDEENGQKNEINYFQLLGLALVDAVNPCELAVLIILMTAILTREPKNKAKALRAGLAFSVAVFIMYLIFGLLIIFGFKSFMGITDLGTSIFYTILAILAIILGLLNIKDAIWYGGGGFIMEVPMRWRPAMKKIIKGTTSARGAFITGLIVSFFLTPCTAGPYFVAGGILAAFSWAETIIPLLFYLLIFISPMIVITLIAYFGFMAVEEMGGWRERNIKLLHWIAGILLLGLGLAMLFGFI